MDTVLSVSVWCIVFFFQAEDGIRDLVRSRGLGDVYKRQRVDLPREMTPAWRLRRGTPSEFPNLHRRDACMRSCLLYTSDAADDLLCVDLGGRRII